MSEPTNTSAAATTKQELDTWFVTVYDELRNMARQRLTGERSDHTLQPTALVNEVFLRLQKDGSLAARDSGRFFISAAEAMRRILIEHARTRGRKKRGGGAVHKISLDAAECVTEENLDEILTFDEAICRLEQQSPDAARLVRLRFYTGLSVEETAKVMDVSEATVMRQWRYARAWLWRELHMDEPV
jgi:RNA polymerase sigma factor (TIGR02999 family)